MYWIVEPHTDDAYLSLHEHIIGPWQAFPKTIITFYGAGHIIKEACYYARATGCEHKWLGLREVTWGDADPVPTDWRSWISEAQESDTLVLPIGIRQPSHVAIAGMDVSLPMRRLWYLDAKYVQQIARMEVQEKVSGMVVESILASSIDKAHYKNIFASQAHRFMLAPDLYPPSVEIVLRKPL